MFDSTRKRMGLLAALATFALLASAGAGASPGIPAFTSTPCTGDFSGVAHKVDCGYVTVEETRGSGKGRKVVMPVAIVRALSPKPGLPPVIFLNGGPGVSFVPALPERLNGELGHELVAQDQDWIFFDQRGAAFAVPALDCGSLPLNDAGPLSASASAGLVACGQRHAAAGVDLSRYNALEVARDVQDLRRALGIDRFDIVGVSYGSRVGFSVIARESQGLRAAVLDSVWPQDATWAVGGPAMISSAVDMLFQRCATDAACHAAFPDPAKDLREVAARFLAGPVRSGDATYTADDFGGFLMDTLYDGAGARSLPRDVHAFAQGNFSALEAQIAERGGYAEAQHLAFLCKERFAFERQAEVAAAPDDLVGQLSVASFKRYFDVCKAYPVGTPDGAENRPVSSDVPTFLLSAEFDPGCPPALARTAVSRLRNGQWVLFPGTTHALARTSACARQMIRAFLAKPDATLDRSCLSTSPERFEFTTR